MVKQLAVAIAPAGFAVLFACSSEISTDRASVPANVATEAPPLEEKSASVASDASRDNVPIAAATLALTSVLYSERDAELTARRRGVVHAIYVELGDQVEAGRELARLDDGEEAAAFAAASAARELARSEHERVSELATRNVVTPAEAEGATYRLRSAEAAFANARVKLDYTRIRAPFAGAVTRRFIRVGQTVEEGDPLFRTTALRPLRALIRVPEELAYSLTAGSPVMLRGLAGQRGTGRILRISPAIDPASGTVEVLVDVADPAGLRPGASIRAEFVTSSRR